MKIVHSVPPGGNWKDIPHSVPSRRLEQIRESFARGEGSRSTYYGRLRPDFPSYTINTYFNRPGNGCHIHYSQDRTLSQREAARLQSFPDNFEFFGSQGAINTQIGNAVPPLLAFQLAKSLGEPGLFVDLFAGAGGMGLGFKWAGWKPVIANDIEKRFLETYARNVHDETVLGSIADPEVFKLLINVATKSRDNGRPFWVLGGPPCQGFSTAGNKRSIEDPRNNLVWDYLRYLKDIQPDGFIFENVTGLLNIQGGSVYQSLLSEFGKIADKVEANVFSTQDFAIPQRRKRVILVGISDARKTPWNRPSPITSMEQDSQLFSTGQKCISVEEALSDLPKIKPGEDEHVDAELNLPTNIFQALMRGLVTPTEYLERIANGERIWK